MDLSNLKMSHGEPSWDNKYNDLVDAVQKVEGATDQIKWSYIPTSSFSHLNGATGDVGATYAQIKEAKIVNIWGQVTVPKGTDVVTAIQIPSDIAMQDKMFTGVYWGTTYWFENDEFKIQARDSVNAEAAFNVMFVHYDNA